MIRVVTWFAGFIVLSGCGVGVTRDESPLSDQERAAITEEMRGVMKEYSAAWSKITCQNQDAVLKFFDWSGPGVIDGNETTVTEYPGDAWPTLIRNAACSNEGEEAGIDTLLVRVFTRDIVTVHWTFHAAYLQKEGPPKLARGAVMQLFRRTPEGWKTPVGMSTHQPMPAK